MGSSEVTISTHADCIRCQSICCHVTSSPVQALYLLGKSSRPSCCLLLAAWEEQNLCRNSATHVKAMLL